MGNKNSELKSEFLFKKYNLQKSEPYMKPALLNIFEMPKDHDCLHKNKKLFPSAPSKICPSLLIQTV